MNTVHELRSSNYEKLPIPNLKAKTRKKFSVSGRFDALFQLVIAIIGFLALLDLTMFFSISINPYVIVLFLIYIVLLPLLSSIRYAYTYFAILPVPYLGSWLISITYLSSFSIPILYASILVSIIPVAMVTSLHVFSRTRNMFGRVPMASFSRTGSALASLIFFMAGQAILGLKPLEFDVINKAIFYGLLLSAYILSSMIYVNSAYRYKVMCKTLNTNRIERKISNIWKKIDNRFSDHRENVDLLRYYSLDALGSFEEGSYEMAFISTYKVINEETVVNPRDYVSDKREGEPSSFFGIRAILMHSRRKDIQINVRKIREIKKKLPQYCIEVLQRASTFLEKLSAKNSPI